MLLLTVLFACKKERAADANENSQAINTDQLSSVTAQTAKSAVNAKFSPSANGQGGITLNGRVQQFSFHASIDKDGNVSGSWESHSPGQAIRTHGTITCLTVLPDGKIALLSGVITKKGEKDFQMWRREIPFGSKSLTMVKVPIIHQTSFPIIF